MGLHLCLTQGNAISPVERVSVLVHEDGSFEFRLGGSSRLVREAGPAVICFQQIHHEFTAQFSMASDYGLKLTHVDSHQHIHMNPGHF